MSYLAAILLGILQGVTEFLPVSSSGHLALAQHLGLGAADGRPGAVAFDILLHMATLLVVLQAFWREITRVVNADRIVLGYLAVASVPAALVGMAGREFIVDGVRQSPVAVCAALLLTGGFIYLCDRFPLRERRMRMLGLGGACAVGLAQALALVPGISRSGLTITGGVVTGLRRDEAVRFSFLLMIPAVAGAAIYDLAREPASWQSLPPGPAAAGFVAAAATGYLALRLLRLMVVRQRLGIFAAYCAVVGGGGLVYFWLF
jgi:undecaprenyl-diphosphatase